MRYGDFSPIETNRLPVGASDYFLFADHSFGIAMSVRAIDRQGAA